LQTRTAKVEYPFDSETTVGENEIYALESMGVERAHEDLLRTDNSGVKFYCVGYTVIKYYLNGSPISVLENHKARNIGAEVIATFLPDEVVSSLYTAVEMAGLTVTNMTLEPIAAIQLAIPKMYRMLNIALIDVGAGTSVISITNDGSIIAYGMLPIAGDALTEDLARHCLVDFVTADRIKRTQKQDGRAVYHDILGIRQEISYEDILAVLAPGINEMAKLASDKIIELNGGNPVSAVFVVGGGGIIEGYTKAVAGFLNLPQERVALRGKEVMQRVVFHDSTIPVSSMLVTPIGICLNYFEQFNNLIYVNFNGKRIKLYDTGKLMIVDAALQADFPNDGLFPKRGKSLTYTVNGKEKFSKGKLGETAQIRLNGETVDLYTSIHANDIIEVVCSTAGEPAMMELGKLPEFKSEISVLIDGHSVRLPKMASVNGTIQTEYYRICDGDSIEMLGYYTVEQLLKVMDLDVQSNLRFFVNSMAAGLDTKVYDNFTVGWMSYTLETDTEEDDEQPEGMENADTPLPKSQKKEDFPHNPLSIKNIKFEDISKKEGASVARDGIRGITVFVNQLPVYLTGKSEYVFVDVFDAINFDLSKPQGHSLVTNINGRPAQYMEPLEGGDKIEVHWKD